MWNLHLNLQTKRQWEKKKRNKKDRLLKKECVRNNTRIRTSMNIIERKATKIKHIGKKRKKNPKQVDKIF